MQTKNNTPKSPSQSHNLVPHTIPASIRRNSYPQSTSLRKYHCCPVLRTGPAPWARSRGTHLPKVRKKMKSCSSGAERLETVQWTVLAMEPAGARGRFFISEPREWWVGERSGASLFCFFFGRLQKRKKQLASASKTVYDKLKTNTHSLWQNQTKPAAKLQKKSPLSRRQTNTEDNPIKPKSN